MKNNVLFENGKVSKKKPHPDSPYAGLVVTHSQSVTLSNNRVRAPSGDFAYTLTGGSTLAPPVPRGLSPRLRPRRLPRASRWQTARPQARRQTTWYGGR